MKNFSGMGTFSHDFNSLNLYQPNYLLLRLLLCSMLYVYHDFGILSFFLPSTTSFVLRLNFLFTCHLQLSFYFLLLLLKARFVSNCGVLNFIHNKRVLRFYNWKVFSLIYYGLKFLSKGRNRRNLKICLAGSSARNSICPRLSLI